MLHTGDPDEGADLNIIKFGTDGKPERTQTPPHPSPEDLFTSQHALSYALVSRLCRTSTRLCVSMVEGAGVAEQLLSCLTWRAATLVIACARARSCRGLWHTALPACAQSGKFVYTGSRECRVSDPRDQSE